MTMGDDDMIRRGDTLAAVDANTPIPAGGPFSHTNSMRVVASDIRRAIAALPAVSAPEDTASDFLDVAVSKAPEPLKELGKWLSRKLDEDDWATVEPLLNAATAAIRELEAERDAAWIRWNEARLSSDRDSARAEAAEASVAELTRERDTLAAHVNQARGLWSGLYRDANDLLARAEAAEARVAELEAKTSPVAYAIPFPPPDGYYTPSASVLHDVASFPNVISAHDIARAVLDEQIDRQQGFVTKEDCCRYVDAILRNLGEDNG